MKHSSIERKISRSVIAIIALTACFVITTAALAYSIVSVEGNIFRLGTMEIDLNGEAPVITEKEFIFEPGMTVKKEFYILNNGSFEVYYRLYFQNINGELAEELEVKICDGDKELYKGKMNELTRENTIAADDKLAVGEKRTLQIYFHLPSDAGNDAQNQFLSFDFAADAVQTANNPEKIFD